MDGNKYLARWSRFAAKGGIGKCTALQDQCAGSDIYDLVFLRGDEVVVLLQLPQQDQYLGFCAGVIGRFYGSAVRFDGILKKPVLARRQSAVGSSPSPSPSTYYRSPRSPIPPPTFPRSPIPPASPSRTLKDISAEIKKLSEYPFAGGGYSDLYIGERLGSEKVALKLVRFFRSMGRDMDATRRRFQNEASLWAELRHPRILEFYGICNHGTDALFMVTPFLENGTILDYLSKVSPDADRVSLLSNAAEGLLYLHSRHPPVVHGDMKASNILITKAGTALLADFGLSKLSHEMTTTMLQGAGSPRWMAPELVLLGDNIDSPAKTQKSDIYAFGHVILEVLSDKLPFFHLKEDVHVLVELLRQGRSRRPDGPVADKWLNDSAWDFICYCTAVNPGERPGIELVVSQMYHRLYGDFSRLVTDT